MMPEYTFEYGNRFLKDLELAKRRGLDFDKLKIVLDYLQKGAILPEQHRDHALKGGYQGYRECHISPDWLLIYQKKETLRIISLYRTGTHSDLFK